MQRLQLSRSDINRHPYYQILVQTDNSEATLILTRFAEKPFQYWQSSAQESLIMANGLIYRTTGLPSNLEQTRFIGTNPFTGGLHLIKDQTTSIREIDLSGYRYGIQLTSIFHIGKKETVTILDEKQQLLRIDENVSAPAIQLKATNHYWIDETGFIWKSEQTLWPGFTLTITQLRPYREDAS